MQRPVSIIVFGILNFVFAALGVIGLISSLALFSVPVDSSDSVIKLMDQGPAYAAWLKICIPLGVLNCVALLAAGFGLLTLKPWARVLSVAYAIYAIVFCVAALLINLIFMAQPMFHQVQPHQQLVAGVALGGPISGTIGELFGPIYPILMLAFMLNSKAVAVFRPPAPPQA
jgi:hypothetical protein